MAGTALTGGRFSLIGSLIGAVVIQTLTTTFLAHDIPRAIDLMVKAGVVMVVCLLQSDPLRARVRRAFRRRRVMTMLAPTMGKRRFWLPSRQQVPLIATAVVCVLLYVVAGKLYPSFFTGRVGVNLISDNAYLGVVAVGMTFVILSGGIDLSVGSIVGCSTIFIAVLVEHRHWHPLAAMGVVLACGALVGAAMGTLIYVFDLPAFLVTLGGLFLFRGLALYVSEESIGITHPFYDRLLAMEIPLDGKLTLPLAAMVFLVVLIGGIYVVVFHPVRPQRVCDRRQRKLFAAHGVAGRADEDQRVCVERFLRGTGGRAADDLQGRRRCNQWSGIGTGRDRGGGGGRHAADRRRGICRRDIFGTVDLRDHPDGDFIRRAIKLVVEQDRHRAAAAGVYPAAKGASSLERERIDRRWTTLWISSGTIS